MAIHVGWKDASHTIIYCEFDAEWTLDEFHRYIDDIYALMTSVTHPVYLIHDYSKSRVPPRQWLSAGRHAQQRQTDNTALSIVVGGNSFVKVMLNVAQSLFLKNLPIRAVDTLEQAYGLIAKHDKVAA